MGHHGQHKIPDKPNKSGVRPHPGQQTRPEHTHKNLTYEKTKSLDTKDLDGRQVEEIIGKSDTDADGGGVG